MLCAGHAASARGCQPFPAGRLLREPRPVGLSKAHLLPVLLSPGKLPFFRHVSLSGKFLSLGRWQPLGPPLQDHLRGFPRLPWELLPPVWPVTGKMLGQGRGPR